MAQLERDMVDAFRKGRSAALARQSWRENPWDAEHELASKRVLAKMWMRGYAKGNPIPDLKDEPVSDAPQGELEDSEEEPEVE